MGTISSNLLIGRDSAEHDFSELSTFEGSICNATSNTNQLREPAKISRGSNAIPDNLQWLLNDSHGQMCAIVD